MFALYTLVSPQLDDNHHAWHLEDEETLPIISKLLSCVTLNYDTFQKRG